MLRHLLVAFCVIASSPLYAHTSPCNQHQCLAVIDAGSTGSRLHVYAYDLDQTNTPAQIHEVWIKKIKPGLATLETNQESIDAYLNTLLSAAPTTHIPVYLYATAGMRLLPPQKQKMLYQGLNNWFTKQDQWQLLKAKTITGNEEALYDWLSVNYHLGTLNAPQTQSVGVMDMGGASVQIVFPVQNNQTTANNQAKIRLYGHDITLSVHSFLGLGQNEVAHQFLDAQACFANNFPLPDGELGQGNARACEQEITSLTNGVHKVHYNIQPLLAANPVTSWFAIGAISNLADNALFHFEKNQLTPQELLSQADNAICHQQWDTLTTRFPDDGYLYGYCLFSAYYYALLVDGYGLSPTQPIGYLPPDQDIDWTLGVVLAHSASKEKSSGFNTSDVP